LHQGTLASGDSLIPILEISQPEEIYHLGGISFVGKSFSHPELISNVTGLGTLRLLESIRTVLSGLKVKIYNASSSEIFGTPQEEYQHENSRHNPSSPYGVAKTFGFLSCANYRDTYSMFVSSGILFNHESEIRDYIYVTRKITSNVARIALGMQERFSLGDLSPRRDWGYAGDYVKAMWLMLQQDNPEDYVISTGVTHSVADFVSTSLKSAGLSDDIEKYVDFDPQLKRPKDLKYLVGDSTKAKKQLGWQPEIDFTSLVQLMVANDLKIESQRKN